MNALIKNTFTDTETIRKLQYKLPKLFQIAELESSRAGKVGMEVGSLRERIIVAFLIHKFGYENINTEIPITETVIDVILYDIPISIKTITGKNFSGVKLIWTVDSQKVINFKNNYTPDYDMIFVQINWNSMGGFYYIPKEVQREVYNNFGKDSYIKLPKVGTNPRGVEITAKALREISNHQDTIFIEIDWEKEEIEFNPFKRWEELWEQEL